MLQATTALWSENKSKNNKSAKIKNKYLDKNIEANNIFQHIWQKITFTVVINHDSPYLEWNNA